ncbi:heat shock 22 kDa protein, mitochondrial [Tanacetum coccineum]
MLTKDRTRQSEREKLSVSSNALRIWPTRVKDNAERLCLYLQMPEVLEDDLKVSVEHNTVVIKGQVYEKLHEYLGFKKYYCWIDPDCIDEFKLSDIKAKMKRKSGELELIIPKLKQEVSVFNVKVDYIE